MSVIVPSYLMNNHDNFSEMVNENHSLKIGSVIDVVFPQGGDPNADPPIPPNPPYPLYTVLVKEKVNGVLVSIPFPNCLLKDMFGSVPDFLEYSLRKSDFTSAPAAPAGNNTDDSDTLGETGSLNQLGNPANVTSPPSNSSLLGATVLIECINGSSFNAIILGAVRTFNPEIGYSQNYTQITDKTGKYLIFNFNGISIQINDDGELSLVRNGPQSNGGNTLLRDAKGNDYEKGNEGSTITINKLGEISISAGNNTEENGSNFKYTPQILLKKNGVISIASGQENDQTDLPNNSIVINKDGSIEITIDNGDNLKLNGKNDDATLTLGSGTYTVAVAEKLQQLYNQLLAQLQILTVSTGTGPSGPPLNAAAFPAWDSSINSAAMKIPK